MSTRLSADGDAYRHMYFCVVFSSVCIVSLSRAPGLCADGDEYEHLYFVYMFSWFFPFLFLLCEAMISFCVHSVRAVVSGIKRSTYMSC